MRYLVLCLLGACAPEYNITHDQPQAGRAALLHEQLSTGDVVATVKGKLTCASDATVCTQTRNKIKERTGATWTWSNGCAEQRWQGTAAGGRVIDTYRWDSALNETERFVYPSQSRAFSVKCWCGSGGGTVLYCGTYWNGP